MCGVFHSYRARYHCKRIIRWNIREHCPLPFLSGTKVVPFADSQSLTSVAQKFSMFSKPQGARMRSIALVEPRPAQTLLLLLRSKAGHTMQHSRIGTWSAILRTSQIRLSCDRTEPDSLNRKRHTSTPVFPDTSAVSLSQAACLRPEALLLMLSTDAGRSSLALVDKHQRAYRQREAVRLPYLVCLDRVTPNHFLVT